MRSVCSSANKILLPPHSTSTSTYTTLNLRIKVKMCELPVSAPPSSLPSLAHSICIFHFAFMDSLSSKCSPKTKSREKWRDEKEGNQKTKQILPAIAMSFNPRSIAVKMTKLCQALKKRGGEWRERRGKWGGVKEEWEAWHKRRMEGIVAAPGVSVGRIKFVTAHSFARFQFGLICLNGRWPKEIEANTTATKTATKTAITTTQTQANKTK